MHRRNALRPGHGHTEWVTGLLPLIRGFSAHEKKCIFYFLHVKSLTVARNVVHGASVGLAVWWQTWL